MRLSITRRLLAIRLAVAGWLLLLPIRLVRRRRLLPLLPRRVTGGVVLTAVVPWLTAGVV